MSRHQPSRRNLLVGIAGVFGIGALSGKTSAAALTPSATEGPYYPTPTMRKPDVDNDLVKITGLVEEAGGEIFTLRGTITGRDGKPRVGHRIEIWQCDTDGNYMHPRDRRSVNFDKAFQGFGHDMTDVGGNYTFRTIKPAIYPGRTPHIHVKILDGDRELLTTQFYVKDDPNNAGDALFRRLSSSEADAVSMEFVRGEFGTEATIDVVV